MPEPKPNFETSRATEDGTTINQITAAYLEAGQGRGGDARKNGNPLHKSISAVPNSRAYLLSK